MGFNFGKKRSKYILFAYLILAYLIIALIGSSVVSAGEALSFEYSSDNSVSSSGYFSSINNNIDWLAGNIITVKKARGSSNSMSRNGLFRLFTPSGTTAMANPAKEDLKIIKNDHILIIKNFVLLKLRI